MENLHGQPLNRDYSVRRLTDRTIDELIGICKGIQLIKDMLFVSIKGGIETITLRFSDKPARSLRLPEEMEKKVRSIIISGSDFSELIESDRLRIMASTLINGIVNEDLDLSGIKDALESIRTGCPIQANASSTPKSEKQPAATCTDALIFRMKAQGLKESQIFAICN